MKLSSFRLATLSAFLFFNVSCSSKSTQSTAASQTANSTSPREPSPLARTAPGAPLSATVDIDGKAFSIDGTSVTARTIISTGLCRRPVFVDANRVAFASRRSSLQRWQVFEADFAKKYERRISFDAGDAEPIVTLGERLVIASSSDERKSGDRLLNKYRGLYAQKTAKPASAEPTELTATIDPPEQHLLLEHPANGRKGTEWLRMTNETAPSWSICTDKEFKQALALQRSGSSIEAFHVSMSVRGREPEARAWSQIRVETPVGAEAKNLKSSPAIVDGKIMPDGKRIVWSNGSMLWTTAMNGKDAKRIGDDSIPAANDLAIDPTGQWIVFSSSTATGGRDLMAIHNSGRCLRTLTELPGDEVEPAFSPDGTKLLFALRQGDSSVIAEIPFGSPAVVAAACP
jgi:WD40 repeat protein